jgi:hypothetical protein
VVRTRPSWLVLHYIEFVGTLGDLDMVGRALAAMNLGYYPNLKVEMGVYCVQVGNSDEVDDVLTDQAGDCGSYG